MRLSVKSDYAARAVLALARHYPDGRARRIEELAAGQGIPQNYLVQILIELKANRIVKSQRGKAGGYLLARPPGAITLGDILRAVYGHVFQAPGQTDPRCPPALQRAWVSLGSTLDQAADAITFQTLLEQETAKAGTYDI